MTPEEIRAEAIKRVTHGLRGLRAMPGATVEQYEFWAGRMVDDLGDLLPTGTESRYIGRGLDRRTRYVTDWKEMQR